jgi:hypothetical protein
MDILRLKFLHHIGSRTQARRGLALPAGDGDNGRLERFTSPLAEFGPASIADTAAVRALLIAAARAGEPVSYSGLLADLGHRFTRPKMRAVCKTLDAIDRVGRAAGEPPLAVLVVRESDGLPGQGWWVGEAPVMEGYAGAWTGRDAADFVRELQKVAFDYWRDR